MAITGSTTCDCYLIRHSDLSAVAQLATPNLTEKYRRPEKQ